MDSIHKIEKAGELLVAVMHEVSDTESYADDIVGRIKKILRSQLALHRQGVSDPHQLIDSM